MRDAAAAAAAGTPFGRPTKLAFAAVALLHVVLVAHRPVMFLPGSRYDDDLFLRSAAQLASGHWLGPYDETTLIKGIGFPAFVALNTAVGLPVVLALCLAYLAAGFYLCVVLRPWLRSDAVVLILFAFLAFIPSLASYETTRMNREFFYTSLVLALTASCLNLLFTRAFPRKPVVSALLAGGLGAWAWLTREEGIWLAPMLALFVALAALPRWALPRPAYWRSESSAHVLVRVAGALATALVLVLAVGAANRIAYGRFVVNEVTGTPFRPALEALERAAYPDWTPFVPVPEAARKRIAAQSPGFARLESILDPPDGTTGWKRAGCAEIPETCGDIAGGWFLWALRDAAARIGAHRDPRTAAAFYRTMAAEVAGACADRRLDCARWLPPLVPPFTRAQMATLPDRIATAARLVAMTRPVWGSLPSSAAPDGATIRQADLLSVPDRPLQSVQTVEGWYYRHGGDWVTVSPTGTTEVAGFDREPGPDVAQAVGDAAAVRQRFTLTLTCPAHPCEAEFRDDRGNVLPLPTAPDLRGWSRPLGPDGGRLTIDRLTWEPTLLRTRAGRFWSEHLDETRAPYTVLILAGAACLLVNLAAAAARRPVPPAALLGAALALGVLCRMALLAAVDATSFPALNYSYMAPALPLAVAGAVSSVSGAVEVLWGWRRRHVRRAGGNGSGAAVLRPESADLRP